LKRMLIDHYHEYHVDGGYSNGFFFKNKMQSGFFQLSLVVARTQCGVRISTEICHVLASPLLPWQPPWKMMFQLLKVK